MPVSKTPYIVVGLIIVAVSTAIGVAIWKMTPTPTSTTTTPPPNNPIQEIPPQVPLPLPIPPPPAPPQKPPPPPAMPEQPPKKPPAPKPIVPADAVGGGDVGDGPVWVVLPASWCHEILLVKRGNGPNELLAEQNAPGTGLNFRSWDNGEQSGWKVPSNVKWRPLTLPGPDYAQLAHYVFSGGKCEPFCPLPDRNKLFKDAEGDGCMVLQKQFPFYVPAK